MAPDPIDTALDRLENALAKAEQRAAAQDATHGQPANVVAEAEALKTSLAALEERHGQLKREVAQGLRQLDEILAGMPNGGAL